MSEAEDLNQKVKIFTGKKAYKKAGLIATFNHQLNCVLLCKTGHSGICLLGEMC